MQYAVYYIFSGTMQKYKVNILIWKYFNEDDDILFKLYLRFGQ